MRELLRAVAKTVVGSFAALLMGTVAVKTIALFIGPEGVGLFSLLRQTQQVAIVLAMVNGQNALVQGIACREGEERARYISVAFWIVLVLAAVVLIVFATMPGEITRWLLGRSDPSARGAFRLLSLSILFGVVSAFSVGILNGHGMVGRASLIQFTNYLVIALLTYPLVVGIVGASSSLAGAFGWLLVAGTGAAAVVAVSIVWRARLLRVHAPTWTAESAGAARHFLTLSSGLLISGVVAVAVPLAVRSLVIRGFDLEGAGIFDAAWTLSMSYVLIVLTSFSSYYLPTLSGLHHPEARRELIARVLRVAIILMLPLVTMVIVFKPLVITLLYSREFTPSLSIMRWMLIGDYFKVMSWVFSYTMLAYADLKMFIGTEVIWGTLTLAAAVFSVRVLHSLEALGFTFALLTMSYFLVMARYVAKRHGFRFGRQAVLQSGAGLAVIVVASMITWTDTVVRWPVAIASVAAATGTSWMLLTTEERRAVRHRLVSRSRKQSERL
ncbi:MAG: hypothetical protein ABI779_04765 [Acidobacteriota bacterium]